MTKKIITQKSMIKYLNKNKKHLLPYKKYGTAKARKVEPGTQVTTVINGVEETKNVAGDNSVEIKGNQDEIYLIDNDKFMDRYKVDKELTNEYQSYQATGKCVAFQYPHDNKNGTTFEAPWGEEMILESEDFLVAPSFDIEEVYRIEKQAFYDSYELDKEALEKLEHEELNEVYNYEEEEPNPEDDPLLKDMSSVMKSTRKNKGMEDIKEIQASLSKLYTGHNNVVRDNQTLRRRNKSLEESLRTVDQNVANLEQEVHYMKQTIITMANAIDDIHNKRFR